MEEEKEEKLKVALGFSPDLRAVFDALPYLKALGYSEIKLATGFTDTRLWELLGKLIKLEGVDKESLKEGVKVLGDQAYFLRVVELSSIKVIKKVSKEVSKEISELLKRGECPCGGRLLAGPRGGLSQMGKCDKCGVEYTVHPWPFDCEQHEATP